MMSGVTHETDILSTTISQANLEHVGQLNVSPPQKQVQYISSGFVFLISVSVLLKLLE